MNILVDVGNSRIKWCKSENGKVENIQYVEYKKCDFIALIEQVWVLLMIPQKLAISSVSNQQVSLQISELAKKLWPGINIYIAKSSSCAFSVTNAYEQPEQLGVDRWLGLIASHYYYPGNSCFVDCGTAITIDCMDKNGQHLGGAISPGLQLMRQSLLDGTENLTFADQHVSAGLSNQTSSAIYSGTLFAAVGLIENVVNSISGSKTIIMSGGNARLVSENLTFNPLDAKLIIELDFVLKGLSLCCREKNTQ